MKEEIPESFWEALVEVKDKDIENARELFLTAMELAKKYKDERDKCQIEHDRALKAWTEAVHERTEALLERDKARKDANRSKAFKRVLKTTNAQLKYERDEYKIGHDRYEKLRRLNLQQIKELYLKNLRTGEHFDILVDKLN